MELNKYLPSGASYEMRTERVVSSSVKFAGNAFESVDSTDKVTHTARVLHDGKLSIASGSKPGGESELVQQAVEAAKYGSAHDVPFVGATQIKEMKLESTETLTEAQMVDVAAELLEDLRSLDSRISAGTTLTAGLYETSLKTSGGFDSSYRQTRWNLSGSISLAQGDDNLGIWESAPSMGPTFDAKALKNTIAKKLEWAKNVVPFKAGTYPVIFSPGEVNYIINPVATSLNGKAIQTKVSPWHEKLGQEVLDSRFTLVDDGSLDGEYTSAPFDIEGTPTRRNVLVENGRIKDLLLNRKTAAQLGMESSGNASAMGASPNHMRINPGDKTFAEMVSSIDYGLLIDGTMGAWSGNPYAGIVTGTISMGLLIENGKIVGRVKDCMFTVKAFEHLKNHLVGFSAELEPNGFMSYNLFPYMMLDQVVISTK